MNPDIYWVSTHILDTLKKIAMQNVSVNKIVEQKVMFYPNPTTGLVYISFGTSVMQATIEITNLQGTLLASDIFHNTTTATIDLTGFSNGIYFIKALIKGVSYEEKIIKEFANNLS